MQPPADAKLREHFISSLKILVTRITLLSQTYLNLPNLFYFKPKTLSKQLFC